MTNFQWLETMHFMTLQLWKSEVQNQSRCGKIKVLAGVRLCLLEALEENPFSCLVQLLEASCIPWLVALHHITFSPSVSIFPWPCVWSSCLLMDTHDYIGATQMIQDNRSLSHLNLITPSKSHLPGKVRYSKVLGIRAWTSLGGVIIQLISSLLYSCLCLAAVFPASSHMCPLCFSLHLHCTWEKAAI